jgi:hypothetical protein
MLLGAVGILAATSVSAQTFEQDEWRFVARDFIPTEMNPLNFTGMLARSPN